ncbi:MAG: hypothetical protein MUC47_02805 [Candidatus Kapabacteria bacterium]|jgi:hypothetical protein|nr:hypothetical protein [Candidatus Kapabacteria bacterium]
MKHFVTIVGAVLLATMMQSCLIVGKKTYKVVMTGQQTGTCTLTYSNIMSRPEDGKDVSFKDFATLVTEYLEGDKLEEDFPGATIISKKLFKRDGKLFGEFVFSFDTLATMKMYRYDTQSPLMMYVPSSNNQTIDATNGIFGGDDMPVLFWPSTAKDLSFTMTSDDDDTTQISLVKHFDAWQASQSPKKR